MRFLARNPCNDTPVVLPLSSHHLVGSGGPLTTRCCGRRGHRGTGTMAIGLGRAPKRAQERERTHGTGAGAGRDRDPSALHGTRRPPLRHRRVGTSRRAHPELERRHRRLPPGRRGVPRHLVAELHQHRRPEVLPRHPRHRRARDVAAPGDRPRRRHDHVVGREGRLLRRRAGGRRLPQRAQGDPRHPARRLQLAGVVQHRRAGRAAAGERVLHPRRRRHDGRHPQLVPRGRHDLQGRFRFRHQPLQHPLVAGAPEGRRHRQRSGELHARRRRVGRHDQERGQDPPRRQDGHPQRRSPRRRGVHLVQVA